MSSERTPPPDDRPKGLLYSPRFAFFIIASLVVLTALMPVAFLLLRGTPWSPPLLGGGGDVFEQPDWSGYWKRVQAASDMPDGISLAAGGTAVVDGDEGVVVVEGGLLKITAGESAYFMEYDSRVDRISLFVQEDSRRYEYARDPGR